MKNLFKFALVAIVAMALNSCGQNPYEYDGVVEDYAAKLVGNYNVVNGDFLVQTKAGETSAFPEGYVLKIENNGMGIMFSLLDNEGNSLKAPFSLDYQTLKAGMENKMPEKGNVSIFEFQEYHGYNIIFHLGLLPIQDGKEETTYEYVSECEIYSEVLNLHAIRANYQGEVLKPMFADGAYLISGPELNKWLAKPVFEPLVVEFNANPENVMPDGATIVSIPESPYKAWMEFDAEKKAILIKTNAEQFLANEDCSYMFHNLTTLTNINLANVNTVNTRNMSYMFAGEIPHLEFVFDNGYNSYDYGASKMALTTISFDDKFLSFENVVTMEGMYQNCYNLTYSLFYNKETPKLKSTRAMFWNCSNMKTFGGMDNFNTSNVMDMSYMFAGCRSMNNTNCPVGKFNTSKVENMAYMFADTYLEDFDYPKFSTESVTNMEGMFIYSKLNNLEFNRFNQFNTSKVTNMSLMFYYTKINRLDLSTFNTKNVTTMQSMFANCENLEFLDLSNFNTYTNINTYTDIDIDIVKVVNMDCMFQECPNIKDITFGKDFIAPRMAVGMFKNFCGHNLCTIHIYTELTKKYLGDNDSVLHKLEAGKLLVWDLIQK